MKSVEKFREMNTLAKKGGIVFFGSDYFAGLHLSELASSFNMNETVYNRSIASLSIDDMSKLVNICVTDLLPEKVFLNLGDADIINGMVDIDDFIKKYEWLLYSIYTVTNAKIYVVSILSDVPIASKINVRLRKLAAECGCGYIDITDVLGSESPDLRMFDMMKCYIRNCPLDFSEAMNIVTVK